METTSLSTLATPPVTPNGNTSVVNRASSNAHAAVDSIAQAVDSAARNAKPAIDHAASMAHSVVNRAAGAAAPPAQWLVDQSERINTTQKRLVADTRGSISAHPLLAVGVAVAAGFLLGRLFRQ